MLDDRERKYAHVDLVVEGPDEDIANFVNKHIQPTLRVWMYWWLYGGDHD